MADGGQALLLQRGRAQAGQRIRPSFADVGFAWPTAASTPPPNDEVISTGCGNAANGGPTKLSLIASVGPAAELGRSWRLARRFSV